MAVPSGGSRPLRRHMQGAEPTISTMIRPAAAGALSSTDAPAAERQNRQTAEGVTIPADVADTIRELEECLLDSEVRADPQRIETLLADEFTEFGSSGRVYDKADAVKQLPAESGLTFSLSDFAVNQLSPQLVLATYRVAIREQGSVRHTLRSSLWVHRSDRWQLLFHQGTPSNPPA